MKKQQEEEEETNGNNPIDIEIDPNKESKKEVFFSPSTVKTNKFHY